MVNHIKKSCKKGREIQKKSYTCEKGGKIFHKKTNPIRQQGSHKPKTKHVCIQCQKMYTKNDHF